MDAPQLRFSFSKPGGEGVLVGDLFALALDPVDQLMRLGGGRNREQPHRRIHRYLAAQLLVALHLMMLRPLTAVSATTHRHETVGAGVYRDTSTYDEGDVAVWALVFVPQQSSLSRHLEPARQPLLLVDTLLRLGVHPSPPPVHADTTRHSQRLDMRQSSC